MSGGGLCLAIFRCGGCLMSRLAGQGKRIELLLLVRIQNRLQFGLGLVHYLNQRLLAVFHDFLDLLALRIEHGLDLGLLLIGQRKVLGKEVEYPLVAFARLHSGAMSAVTVKTKMLVPAFFGETARAATKVHLSMLAMKAARMKTFLPGWASHTGATSALGAEAAMMVTMAKMGDKQEN